MTTEPNSEQSSAGGTTIGGSVGTHQQITITGGTVAGSIIGSQTTVYGSRLPAPTDESTTGATQVDIDEQQELLELHRRTLASYLKRLARVGTAHAPPEIDHGIREARDGIRRAKTALRGWGAAAENHPDDEAAT